MKQNLLAVAVMGALLLAPPPATAQDPWDDVRALDAALAPPDAAAPAVRMVAPASAAPRSAAVPKPVPRPMPRPAIPAAVPAVVPAAARAPAPDAMPAPTPVAAPASALPASVPVAVPLPPARPALAPAAAPLALAASPKVPPPPLETAVPADEIVPELADLPWLVDVPETAPVSAQTSVAQASVAPTSAAQTSIAQASIAQASVVRTSVAQDTFAPEAFAPETFAPKAFVPQAVAAQAPGMQAHAIQALASQTVASPPLAAPPTAPQAVAAAAPSAPAEPPTDVTPSQPVAGALSLLSVPVVSIFAPAQAAEEAAPGEAREEPVEPAATDAPAAGEAAPQEASQEAAKEAPQEGPVLPPAPPLYREVRELQRLQDSMAVGVPGALPAQNALIAHIDQLYRAADASVWNDPQNARALVIFALSGGGPGVLRAVLGKSAVPNIDERLLRGSLAYLEGREPEALKQLGEIDMRSLPDSLAGQVALAQAALWVRRDPARAAVLLGRARLIAPGTLVEEAALRRAIFIAAQADDLGTFERMTATYLARFRHSVYAGNFRQRFAAALTRMSFIDKPDEFDRINDLLAPLEPAGRREVALLVAQAAVSQGKTTAAERAAELVLKGAVFGSLEADRAMLYRAAATITSPQRFAEAQTELASVASERFAPDDARLLGAAQTVAASILHAVDIPPPEEGGGATPAADPAAADPAATDSPAVADTGPPPATLAKAQAALASVDQLLGDAPL